jgi:hypothetical protein
VARQSNTFSPHPGFQLCDERRDARPAHPQTLRCRVALDLALDGEDRINAPDRFQGQWRDHAGRFALRLAPGICRKIRQDEERPAGMRPTGRLDDRPRLAIGLVQLVVAAIGIGLEDPGIAGQMPGRMIAPAIARIVEHRRRRVPATKWSIVAHINPTSPGGGLSRRQHRHARVVAVQPLGGKNVCLHSSQQRCQHGAARPHLVGQGRQAERHSLPCVAFGLAVQWLMLPVLLEQDHRQQTWAGPAAGDHMKGGRRLADLLAVAAGELLADVLDHLPAPRDHLQRLGDVLAQLA